MNAAEAKQVGLTATDVTELTHGQKVFQEPLMIFPGRLQAILELQDNGGQIYFTAAELANLDPEQKKLLKFPNLTNSN